MTPLAPASPVMSEPSDTAPRRDAQASVGGVLICGGRSRRMGRDKALLEVDGRTMIQRAAQLLGGTCSELLLACGPEPRYGDLGFPLVLDGEPDGGPLAGICAGLKAITGSHAMVLACDMPHMTRALVESLQREALDRDLDVCYLATERGVEPLCAVYSRRCVPAMEAALSQGVRKVTGFLQEGPRALRVGQVDLEPRARLGNPLCNVNTPADLDEARAQGDGASPEPRENPGGGAR